MTELEKSIREIPALLKTLREKFLNTQKFGEIKTIDGILLSYDGDVPEAGQDIFVIEGEEKLPAPDGDYETEIGIISVKEGKIVDVKLTEQEQEQEQGMEGSDFLAYLKSNKYLDDTVSYLTSKGMTTEKAVKNIKETFEANPVFAHLFQILLSQKTPDISVEMKKQRQSQEAFDLEIKSLRSRITGFERQMKVINELFDIIERLSKSPSVQSDFKRNNTNNSSAISDLQEWRKKYMIN